MMLNINLPDIPDDGIMTGKQARQIIEHLHQLREELRYMFEHIGMENLTEELKEQIETGGTGVNAIVLQRLEDAEGNVSRIIQDTDRIELQVQNLSGDVSLVKQQADQLTLSVSNMEGQIASLDITASGIMAAVNNNRLKFTAAGLQILNAYGQVVFDQSIATGAVTMSGNIYATGGQVGGLDISPTGLSYGLNFVIDNSGSYSHVRIGSLQMSGNTNQGMTFGDPEAPVWASNLSGMYVRLWQQGTSQIP